MKTLLCLTLLFSFSVAEDNVSYVDDTHHNISNKVIEWSDNLDAMVSGWLGNKESNTSLKIKEHNRTKPNLTVDAFFQNNKYFDETDNTFVRVRTDSTLQTKESNKFNLRLSAQIPFSRSRQNFKFFVDDLTIDNAKNILQDDDEDTKVFPEIGLHYFAPENYGIVSRYSLGFQGISPFIRGRYSMDFQTEEWNIEPVQTLKYSSNDGFEEETNIYIDKEFSELSLLRLQLHRKTQEEVAGMDYALILEYYWSPIDKTAIRISQGFFGNTKFPYISDNSTEANEVESFSGINNYVTSISWRQNIWRDWFYYEISPSVNFHKKYDYETNYSIRVFFDFYIGKYK